MTENQTKEGKVMTCILKRSDYLELTEAAAAASRESTNQIGELATRLTASLNPVQRSIFAEIEELTSLETVQAQDGLARLLCGCMECRAKLAE